MGKMWSTIPSHTLSEAIGGQKRTRSVNVDKANLSVRVGKAIEDARLEKGLGVRELLDRVGVVNPSTYNRIKMGEALPPLYLLMKIARVLRLSIDEIVGLRDQ